MDACHRARVQSLDEESPYARDERRRASMNRPDSAAIGEVPAIVTVSQSSHPGGRAVRIARQRREQSRA